MGGDGVQEGGNDNENKQANKQNFNSTHWISHFLIIAHHLLYFLFLVEILLKYKIHVIFFFFSNFISVFVSGNECDRGLSVIRNEQWHRYSIDTLK